MVVGTIVQVQASNILEESLDGGVNGRVAEFFAEKKSLVDVDDTALKMMDSRSG